MMIINDFQAFCVDIVLPTFGISNWVYIIWNLRE